MTQLRCADQVNLDRAVHSIGSLGGGNHFIEVDQAGDGRLFLVIHSGSRHLGTEVADYYQNEGRRALWGGARHQIQETIAQLKAEGRFQEIQKTITALKKERVLDIPKDLAYVEGKLFDDYIHDMKLTQRFAVLNRKAMADIIVSGMGFTITDEFTTIHNYIDTDAMILRKGSVSAKAGEKLLIPINMRDGSLICIGKGNEEWNCSAPHGAGRLMSRRAALNTLSMETFRSEMEGIELCNSSSGHLCFLERGGMKGIYQSVPDCIACMNLGWAPEGACSGCLRLAKERAEEVGILQLGVGLFADKAVIKKTNGALATVPMSELTIID